MSNSEAQFVNYSIEQGFGILSIGNGVNNALLSPKFLELSYLKTWIIKNDFSALIITGNDRCFSSGADLEQLESGKKNIERFIEEIRAGREILDYIESLPIITVAAVNGICFGGGLEIALAFQFIISSSRAIFALPESNLGIMPGLGGIQRLSSKLNKAKTIELVASGSSFTAQQGFEMGLVHKIVEDRKMLLKESIQFVSKLIEGKTKYQINAIIESINSTTHKPDRSFEKFKTLLEMSEKRSTNENEKETDTSASRLCSLL